jgi:hypothetical protein
MKKISEILRQVLKSGNTAPGTANFDLEVETEITVRDKDGNIKGYKKTGKKKLFS